jgi:hypothetical protein
MSNEFQIGKSDFSKKTFSKANWFKLEIGDNLFRLLPPLFSLAATGVFKVFYSTHGGFKNARGNQIKFQCIEKKDFKTKIISQYCPVCDLVEEYKKQYDELKKSKRATDQQLSAFHQKFVMPFQADKKFYLNAINTAGEIGLLPLPYKCAMSLDKLLETESSKGKDPTGIDGAFINFSKQSRYKGDPQVNYFANLAFEQDGDVLRVKKHTLTADVINQIKDKAKDLGTLYRTFTPEQIANLVNADEPQRVTLMESYIGTAETVEEENTASDGVLRPLSQNTMGRTIPGTDAIAVVRTELTPNGFEAIAPQAPTAYVPPTPAPAGAGYSAPVATPTAAPVAAAVVSTPVVTEAPAAGKTMSDDEFAKIFNLNQGLKR